jgi:glycosyltransferase involved in cell wall biosynthesis
MTTPDYILECSWEVCNKIGGIYTVLSTKARTLQQQFADRLIFIGPDFNKPNPEFREDTTLFPDWIKAAGQDRQLRIKVGRWNIPGNPPVILVDFQPFFAERDMLFFTMWESFGVDSSRSYGDYDEACMFAYATGQVIQSWYDFHQPTDPKIIAHFHEWMLGMGALHVQKCCPEVATVFTTHATSIGRSIAGNRKPLYSFLSQYDGDQMARELNMEAKHSIEKQTARFADCFTTVSEITALECKHLLCKEPDIVTPNGFEPDFVPAKKMYSARRNKARRTLLNVAGKLLGETINPDVFLVATGGRYEYRNKGIDVFIDVMNHLRVSNELQREVIAFIMVPAWVYAPRADLKEVLDKNIQFDEPLQTPFLTHWLHQMNDDRVMNFILQAGFTNHPSEKLKIIFVPCYLDGQDGIFNQSYYDLLIGMDATVFPSCYEPWGYTPLESIAFGIPTITTDLAGFGLWAKHVLLVKSIDEVVAVVHRTDDNYFATVHQIAEALLSLTRKSHVESRQIQNKCLELASQAEWRRFIIHYYKAFDVAFANAARRIGTYPAISCK